MENGKLMMMEINIIEEKSLSFAIRITKLYKMLTSQYNEYVISKQMLRSGTSIGANVSEAQNAQSRADFLSKMNIALKEATETKYWLRLLHGADYLSDAAFQSIFEDCIEIEKILVAIVRTTKNI